MSDDPTTAMLVQWQAYMGQAEVEYREALAHVLAIPHVPEFRDEIYEARLELFRANERICFAAMKLGLRWCVCDKTRKTLRAKRKHDRNMPPLPQSHKEKEAEHHTYQCDRHLIRSDYYSEFAPEDCLETRRLLVSGGERRAVTTNTAEQIIQAGAQLGYPVLDLEEELWALGTARHPCIPVNFAVAAGETAWTGFFRHLPVVMKTVNDKRVNVWGIVMDLAATKVKRLLTERQEAA